MNFENEFEFASLLKMCLNKHTRYNEIGSYEKERIEKTLLLHNIKTKEDVQISVVNTGKNNIFFINGIELETNLDKFVSMTESDYFHTILSVNRFNAYSIPDIIIIEDYFNFFFNEFSNMDMGPLFNAKFKEYSYDISETKSNDKEIALMCKLVHTMYDELERVQDILYHPNWFYTYLTNPEFEESLYYYKKAKYRIYNSTNLAIIACIYNEFPYNKRENTKKFLRTMLYECGSDEDNKDKYIFSINIKDPNDEIEEGLLDIIESYLSLNEADELKLNAPYYDMYLNISLDLKDLYTSQKEEKQKEEDLL